jgi:transposase-like protein
VTIVWPCSLPVDIYARAGRAVEVPRPDCPSCSTPMAWWSGYRRDVRDSGGCHRIFVPRVRCRSCEKTHAVLPAFVLVGRLDVVESIAEVIAEVAAGRSGVRPPAGRLSVPHTTARGWWRRFRAGAARWAVAFAALAVELGGRAVSPVVEAGAGVLAAIAAAWRAAVGLPGWSALGVWRFVSMVTGGRLIATNTDSPWLIVGSRRFMPPVP